MGGTDKNANRGVYAIIAAAVSLLSLQFDQVPTFFQIIFPKVGIALSVLLAMIILMGLFIPDPSKRSGAGMIFFIIGAILAVIVLLTSFDDYTWWTGGWWQNNISAIVAGIILIIFVAIIINSGKVRDAKTPPFVMQVCDGEGK